MGNEPDYKARFTGLQQVHQNTVQQLKDAQALLQQSSQHSGTLEQQLGSLQAEHQQSTQQLGELQAQQTQLQTENQFWNLVATEFPQLMPLAQGIQRVPDVEQQRQILTGQAQVLARLVQNQSAAQVTQALEGVVPGASPPAGGGAPQYDRETVARKLEETVPGTPEYKNWKRIWDEITKDDPKLLHPEWKDPLKSDWETIEDNEGYLEPTTAPGTGSVFLQPTAKS
jgi:hypothetical protein